MSACICVFRGSPENVAYLYCSPGLRHLVDVWSRVGARWILKGPQTKTFFEKWNEHWGPRQWFETSMICWLNFDVEMVVLNLQEKIALDWLEFKRLRWSGKLIENGGPNGGKKASKLKHWASKVWLFEFFWISASLFFWRFWVLAKGGTKSQQISFCLRNIGSPGIAGDSWGRK